MPIAFGRQGQDDLLGRAQLGDSARGVSCGVAGRLPRRPRRGGGLVGVLARSARSRARGVLEIGGALVRRGRRRARRMAMEMTLSPSARRMPRTPVESRPANTRTSSTEKRMQRPSGGGQQDVVLLGVQRPTPTMRSPSSSFMAILPVRLMLTKSRQLVAPDVARAGGEHHVQLVPGRLVLRQRQDRGDGLARLDRQQVDEGLAARRRRAQRQAPDLQLVDLAARREEQHRRVGGGGEDAGDRVLVLGRHARAALAAAMLGPVGRQRRALHIAAVGDGDDHVLAGDQVLVLDVGVAVDDLRCGAARRRRRGPRPVPRGRCP